MSEKFQPAARVHLREQHMALQLDVPLQALRDIVRLVSQAERINMRRKGSVVAGRPAAPAAHGPAACVLLQSLRRSHRASQHSRG